MHIKKFPYISIVFILLAVSCSNSNKSPIAETVTGTINNTSNGIWLSHEHLMVDFIGSDSIREGRWDRKEVIYTMKPYLEKLQEYNVEYFVDATPAYLGRDVKLLQKLSELTGIKIITNTGFYGARQNKFVPAFAFNMSPEELAAKWIEEYRNGIEGTSIKPGFIKIGVDPEDTLDPMHIKLVKAAGITSLETGLTIASHTGKAKGFWLQWDILKEMSVAPDKFIWVHAQNEKDNSQYNRAAEIGCWISLDGMGWETEKHIQKLEFAKKNGILDHILISHDAGWYDPENENQQIKPFITIFEDVIPALREKGFTDKELDLLIKENPASAFSIN